MSTETQTRPRRRSMLFGLDEALLFPRDTTNLPAPIAETNERAWLRFEAMRKAQQRSSEAAEIAKAAPRHDKFALEAALAADEKPPKQTTPAKREKAEAAKREADAAEAVAKRAVFELWDAVEENHDEYLAGREAAFAAVADSPERALAELESSWEAVEREGELLALAKRWHNNTRSATLSPSGSGRARAIQRRFSKAESDLELRSQHRRNPDVANTFEHLVVALRRKVEEAAES